MGDQSPDKNTEILSLAGNTNIPCNTRIAEVFLKNKGVVLPLSSYLDREGQIKVVYHPPLSNKLWTTEPLDLYEVKAYLQGFLENAIKANPNQYNWSYPRIKAEKTPSM